MDGGIVEFGFMKSDLLKRLGGLFSCCHYSLKRKYKISAAILFHN